MTNERKKRALSAIFDDYVETCLSRYTTKKVAASSNFKLVGSIRNTIRLKHQARIRSAGGSHLENSLFIQETHTELIKQETREFKSS